MMKRICSICFLCAFMLLMVSCGKTENTRNDYVAGSSQNNLKGQEKDSSVSEKCPVGY